MKNTSESSVMLQVGRAARSECERQGHDAQTFWVAGAGSKSTDELAKMMNMVAAWKPNLIISLHSDAGSGGARDIYPLVGSSADTSWATKVGKEMASRVGFGFQAPSVRGELLFFGSSKGFKRILLEIGQHDNKGDALFNATYADFLGVQAARAVLKVQGALKNDGPIIGYKVPPGQGRWSQVAVVVEHSSASGLFAGDKAGKFNWDMFLTRGQADTVLSRLIARHVGPLSRGMLAVVERVEALEASGK